MTDPVVAAVCVVAALRPDPGLGVSAIDKRPVTGPVRVRPLGLHGDVQVNRKHHGGVDQAVYAYSSDAARFWAGELGRDLAPGWFGENLRIDGLDVDDARSGDRWTVGRGDAPLVLEVTKPRAPCATFARWVGGADERGWVKRFTAAGMPGAYLRVVRAGVVRAGDPVVVDRAHHGTPTMRELMLAAAS